MENYRVCWKCKGITDEEHRSQISGKLFTADMKQCSVCKKSLTSSSFNSVEDGKVKIKQGEFMFDFNNDGNIEFCNQRLVFYGTDLTDVEFKNCFIEKDGKKIKVKVIIEELE